MLAVLAGSAPGIAQIPPKSIFPATTDPAAPPGPAAAPAAALRIGALLPLTGYSSWYGTEMRQGLELAQAEIGPPPPRPALPTPVLARPAVPESRRGREEGRPLLPTPALPTPALPTPLPADPGARTTPASESPGAVTTAPEVPVGPPPLKITLDVVDVAPLSLKEIETSFVRVAGAGAPVVFTASPTPTLAVYPLAVSRDVLLIYQGVPTERFPPPNRSLLLLRPSPVTRGKVLAAYARERGLRRMAFVGAGDPFGRAVRTTLAASLRDRGAPLAAEMSLSLDTPDLRAQLGRIARLAPDVVGLGFRGTDLGEAARQLRAAGYTGLLLAVDDDPAAWLAAGPALENLLVLSDAFVPEADSRAARFAKAYEAKFRRAPSRFAANAYEALLMVANGIRGEVESGRSTPGGGRLRDTLAAQRHLPALVGGELTLRDDGVLDRPLALFAVEAGRAIFVRYVGPDGRPVLESRLPLAHGARFAWILPER